MKGIIDQLIQNSKNDVIDFPQITFIRTDSNEIITKQSIEKFDLEDYTTLPFGYKIL